MPDVTVKTVKGFNADGLGIDDKYLKRGAELIIDESLARDLHRNGLIEDYDSKAAVEPDNKKAPDPKNKSTGKSPQSKT